MRRATTSTFLASKLSRHLANVVSYQQGVVESISFRTYSSAKAVRARDTIDHSMTLKHGLHTGWNEEIQGQRVHTSPVHK